MVRISFLAVLLVATAGLAAGQQTTDDLTVAQPWARATAPNAQSGVIYLTIANKGAGGDRLVGVSTDVAAMAELHESMSGAGGVMTMEAMSGGIAIPPGQTVTLKPGGAHVMLMGLKRPLKPGDKVPLTLTFEKAGKVAVIADVATAGAAGPPAH